jgi:hypothetical protein
MRIAAAKTSPPAARALRSLAALPPLRARTPTDRMPR